MVHIATDISVVGLSVCLSLLTRGMDLWGDDAAVYRITSISSLNVALQYCEVN